MAATAETREREELQRQCRFYRHAWEVVPTPPGWRRTGHFTDARYVLHLRCIRCTSVRNDGFDSNGDLVARSYDMVEGYSMSADERPSTMELRLWMVKRRARLSRMG
jgi:hypothetical protein